MIIKKQIKLTPKKISKWLTIIIVLIITAALYLVSFFLYKNFYQAIAQTNEIKVLNEKVVMDIINIKKFDEIINKLTKKTTPKELNNIISPF